MLKLTDYERRRDAESLVDRLLVAGIEGQVRGARPWEVWVLDHDQIKAARDLLDASGSSRRGDTRAAAAKIRADRERGHKADVAKTTAAERRWHESAPSSLPAITIVLATAAVMVGLSTDLGADPRMMTIQNLSIEPWTSDQWFGRVRAGEIWRLFTPVLVHFGFLHLLFNGLWLARFGAQIERIHGPGTLAMVVVLSGLVGNVGQYLVTGPNFGGLSGVVYGLFGFIWMHVRHDGRPGYTLRGTDVVFIMAWFVACATGVLGNIANVGHAGGLVVGLLLGLPPYLRHLRGGQGQPPRFTEGSWEDVNITGWRRIVRRYVTPYAPLWFLALAAAVTLVE